MVTSKYYQPSRIFLFLVEIPTGENFGSPSLEKIVVSCFFEFGDLFSCSYFSLIANLLRKNQKTSIIQSYLKFDSVAFELSTAISVSFLRAKRRKARDLGIFEI